MQPLPTECVGTGLSSREKAGKVGGTHQEYHNITRKRRAVIPRVMASRSSMSWAANRMAARKLTARCLAHWRLNSISPPTKQGD